MRFNYKIILLVIFSLFLSFDAFAQGRGPGMSEGARKKLDDLENIKLIEALDLKQDVSAKVISRKNEHHKNMMQIENEKMDALDQLEAAIRNDNNEKNIVQLTKKVVSLETKGANERKNFLESLNSILTPVQKAKFLVFERKFRDEVRTLLMHERKNRGRD